MRSAVITRATAETEIELSLNLDGMGRSQVRTGCGFMDHMLTLFAAHSGYDLNVSCNGDTDVDDHHTVEDLGICLGKAFLEALGDKRGLVRYGHNLSAVDISGRSTLVYDLDIPTQKVGFFDTELVEEFWLAFVREARVSLHIKQMAGKNSHHIIEGCFKSVARSLAMASTVDEDKADLLPSTKGVL